MPMDVGHVKTRACDRAARRQPHALNVQRARRTCPPVVDVPSLRPPSVHPWRPRDRPQPRHGPLHRRDGDDDNPTGVPAADDVHVALPVDGGPAASRAPPTRRRECRPARHPQRDVCAHGRGRDQSGRRGRGQGDRPVRPYPSLCLKHAPASGSPVCRAMPLFLSVWGSIVADCSFFCSRWKAGEMDPEVDQEAAQLTPGQEQGQGQGASANRLCRPFE
ncbi:hypothetical protein BD413DRAFT_206153 [Trametes elegans]|nr:hypothetical protein BD413DRAFT_206153 [Trametes elegans]